MIAIFKKRPPTTLIGLKLERNRMEGVVLRRTNGGLQVQRSFQTSLSLDPLTNDPELVGREIRNHLNDAGVREKRCVVCVPLNWALTLQTKVPALAEADVRSFLDVEAEKGFPYAPDDLSISYSRYRAPGGEQHATIVAIPKNHLALLERALKGAQLKPLSFSLAISALQSADKESDAGVVALLIGESNLELQLTSGDGVVALRSLEGAVETDGNQKQVDADLVAREIKITLGQLPRPLSETIRKLRLFGRPELTLPLLKELRTRVASMGLEAGTGGAQQINGFQSPLSTDQVNSPALGMAARHMLGQPHGFEFLPPKVSAWPQAFARFSSRKLVSVGATSAVVVLFLALAFFFQHWKLSSLDSKWRSMEPRVVELDGLQQQIRKFRPWYDESIRSLRIIRRLTEAFPEDGSVSVKRLEIKDLSTISCSGVAKDNQAYMKMLDQFAKAKEVVDLHRDQVRGKAPDLQFTFNFRWNEGVSYEN